MARTLIAAGAIALALPLHEVVIPITQHSAQRIARDDLPPVAWAPQDTADETYKRARDALTKGEYRDAAVLFKQIIDRWPTSTYVPASLYWRASALTRLGGPDDLREAERILQEHDRRFPNAGTVADSKALATRIRGELARMGDERSAANITEQARRTSQPCPSGDDDDDVRVAAINALQQMDGSRALPILREVLKKREACSEPLRRKAVFILSQQESQEAGDLLLETARNDPSAEVREQAVQWLGQMKGERITAALEEIALRSTDEKLREKAIFALSQQETSRASAVLRAIAGRAEAPEKLRENAIRWLGQNESPENAQFLRNLFTQMSRTSGSDELRRKILFSLSQMEGQGNDRWLMSVATDTTQSIEVRKHALFSAGQADVPASELITLYGRVRDRPMKEQVIWVLSQSDEKTAIDKLIDIARNDTDVQMRKKALFWLSQKDDPRVQQLLLEIINKG